MVEHELLSHLRENHLSLLHQASRSVKLEGEYVVGVLLQHVLVGGLDEITFLLFGSWSWLLRHVHGTGWLKAALCKSWCLLSGNLSVVLLVDLTHAAFRILNACGIHLSFFILSLDSIHLIFFFRAHGRELCALHFIFLRCWDREWVIYLLRIFHLDWILVYYVCQLWLELGQSDSLSLSLHHGDLGSRDISCIGWSSCQINVGFIDYCLIFFWYEGVLKAI